MHVPNILSYVRYWGFKQSARVALSRLGIRTLTTASYPALQVSYEVEYDPVWKIVTSGTWEHPTVDYVTKHVKSGSTILDVGAWIGTYSLLFSKLVGKAGRVVSFEPDPRARKVLNRNLELNSINNVFVENLCVSDHVGDAQLRTLRLGDSASSLVRYRSSTEATEIPVKTTTLDDYCSKTKIIPAGIKIDVEGAEGMVFNGMSKLLDHSPWVVMEFHPDIMSPHERRVTWSITTDRAEMVTYLGGDATNYSEGQEIPRDKGFPCPNGSRFQLLLNF